MFASSASPITLRWGMVITGLLLFSAWAGRTGATPEDLIRMNEPHPPGSPESSSGAADQLAPARALLEAHVTWLGGWPALNAFQSLALAGQIEVSGLSGTIEDQERRDGYRRTDYDLGVVSGTETVTPDDAWSLNASGQLEDMGVEQAAVTRRSLARTFSAHLVGEEAGVEHRGSEERDGRSWEVVRFRYPNGDFSDLLLDPEDGSSTWQREITDTDTVWTRLSDWRVVDGLRFSFVQETLHEHAAANQTVRWERVETNIDLPDALFERPGAGRQVARVEDPSGSTAWMPIDLHLGRYVYLSGEVNGQPTDIVLDSGAGITVLDRATADRLHLEMAGSLPAQGVAGRTEAGLVQDLEIRIGSLVLDGLTGAVIDLSDVNRRIGRDLAVILGKEVFHNTIVELDYPEARIRFHDPGRYHYQGDGRRVALFAGADGHKEVEVSIEGLEPAKVGLDTGSGSTLSIFGPYVEEHGLLAGRSPLSEHMSAGVGGTSVSAVGTVRSLTFAGYTMENVPVSFHREDVGAFATKRQAGNLGAGILGRFRVFFDYPSNCLWVEPGRGWGTAPFERDRSGLQTDRESGGEALEVTFVAPNSPAALAGWKVGERITAIDGRVVGPDYFGSAYKWNRAAAGTKVQLRLASGEERELVLTTYY